MGSQKSHGRELLVANKALQEHNPPNYITHVRPTCCTAGHKLHTAEMKKWLLLGLNNACCAPYGSPWMAHLTFIHICFWSDVSGGYSSIPLTFTGAQGHRSHMWCVSGCSCAWRRGFGEGLPLRLPLSLQSLLLCSVFFGRSRMRAGQRQKTPLPDRTCAGAGNVGHQHTRGTCPPGNPRAYSSLGDL